MDTTFELDRPLPPPPTRKGRETRERFKAAFRVVIARDGYLNARIADVATEAGKSLGLLYNYYNGKEDLLTDIAAEFQDEMAEGVGEPFRRGLAPDIALRESIRIYWDLFRRHRAEMVGIFQASMIDARFAAEWRRLRAIGVQRIAVGIRAAQRHGDAPGIDPELAGSALISMVDHFCYVWISGGGDEIGKPFDEERALETLWQIWSRAIYTPSHG